MAGSSAQGQSPTTTDRGLGLVVLGNLAQSEIDRHEAVLTEYAETADILSARALEALAEAVNMRLGQLRTALRTAEELADELAGPHVAVTSRPAWRLREALEQTDSLARAGEVVGYESAYRILRGAVAEVLDVP